MNAKNIPMTCSDSLINDMSPELIDLFKALSDPRRLAIVAQLAGCCNGQTVSEVASCCPVDISVVSRHLKTLRQAGICEATKQGKEVYYKIKINELVSILRNIADALETCCPEGSCEIRESCEVRGVPDENR